MIERIPYNEPVKASATIARLFKAHLLFDWLIQTLYAEREKLGETGVTVANITRDYIKEIGNYQWAKHLRSFLQAIVDNKAVDAELSEQLFSVYRAVFIGREEFVTSFKDHFTKAAEERKDLLNILSPVWNDMVVLSDFASGGNTNFNIFPAVCLAAYHKAPLLLFPAITTEKEEKFIEQKIKNFESQFFKEQKNESVRNVTRRIYREDIKEDPDLARLIFPSDVMAAMQSLNPLTVALYSTDINVPYEAISDSDGPMFLKYAMAHLSGTDAYETSIITASTMLYAHDLQRQEHLRVLLCMANLPKAKYLKLEKETIDICKALNDRFVLIESGILNKLEHLDQLQLNLQNFLLNYASKFDIQYLFPYIIGYHIIKNILNLLNHNIKQLDAEILNQVECFEQFLLNYTSKFEAQHLLPYILGYHILKNILNLLNSSTKQFDIDILNNLKHLDKKNLTEKLAEQVHIFHFAGHGTENAQPQRSGILFYNPKHNSQYTLLNALEIKYHTKLGAHPIVFINACFPGKKGIVAENKREQEIDTTVEMPEKSRTAKYSKIVMGVSSSFIHIGASAVMAPFWEITDDDAILYAGHWYSYLRQGCSISEAALLAKIDSYRLNKLG